VSAHGHPGDITNGQIEAAEAALAHVRESLLAAARGDVDATDLRRSLLGYVDQHGPALRGAAATVGEEVRRQLLEQLYGWRAQLDDQLGSHRRPPPETPPG
jgi:hypothetical protein